MLAAARAEMLEAAAFYEKQQKMLGKRFLAAVQEAFTKVRIKPNLFPVVEGDLRRCLVRVFPYGIVFRVARKQIVIISVMHLHRDPEHWKERQ